LISNNLAQSVQLLARCLFSLILILYGQIDSIYGLIFRRTSPIDIAPIQNYKNEKSGIKKMPEYFDRYIHKTDDVTYIKALEIGLNELESLPLSKWEALGDPTYAERKVVSEGYTATPH
jgi:hypothetical protein